MPKLLGDNIKWGFGVIPSELINYGYFTTTLKDHKKEEEINLIDSANKYQVKDMANQAKEFHARSIL